MKVKSETEVAQLCLALHNPMDCSLPGSSIHGIFQARVLEWVAIAFSVYECRIQHEPGMWAKKRSRGHFRGFSHPVMGGTELVNGQGLACSRGVVEDFSRSCVYLAVILCNAYLG